LKISFKDCRIDSSDEVHTTYYPPPISRQKPDWSLGIGLFYAGTEKFEHLFEEIYTATQNNLPRLALMGIRALLEQVMILKVGDHRSFRENLKKFQEAGYISVMQFDALDRILDAGHAVIHRGYTPKGNDLNTALDVMEGILAAIFVHDQHTKWLEIPERVSKPTE
jgi:hypothetical protein